VETHLALAQPTVLLPDPDPVVPVPVSLSVRVPVVPPTEPMQALTLEDETTDPEARLLDRILATLQERQINTHECIEISNITWRTAR